MMAEQEQGVAGAWTAFVCAHWEALYWFVNRLLGRRSQREDPDTEETVQEAFCRAFQHWGEFESNLHAKRWLYVVARRLAADLLRGPRRHREVSLDVLFRLGDEEGMLEDLADEAAPDPAQGLESEDLNRFVAQLPPHYQTVLFLRYHQGFSRQDIAAILEVSEQRVSNYLHRACRKLRDLLGEDA